MANVVTSIAFILDDLLTKIKTVNTSLHHVYDEQLSVETGIQRFREFNNIESATQPALPLFIFKREHLQPTDLGRRANFSTLQQKSATVGNAVQSYQGFIGKIVVSFIYVAPNMEDVDSFEVLYAMEKSINSIKEIEMNVAILGQWQYACVWSELEELIIQTEGIYHKALSGRVEIKGPLLAFDVSNKYILTVNSVVKSVSQSVDFSTVTVP